LSSTSLTRLDGVPSYLAVDLGAESGRVLRGTLSDGRLTVTEVYRFANRPVQLPTGLHWNVLSLYDGITAGLAAGAAAGPVDGIGIDAWGNDFALLDQAGHLVGNPFHYRDPRTDGMPHEVASRVGAAELYRVTGTPCQPITTSSQLLAMEQSPLLSVADRLMMLPDLFLYWLTGSRTTEETIASTSQLFDVRSRRWAIGVIEKLGLPTRLFAGDVVPPGTAVGRLRAGLVKGLDRAVATTVAGHDTASAVAAVPGSGHPAPMGYIASGTWCLVGLELRSPVLTEEARGAGFSNELGVAGTVRFLRNGTGLWLLQRCREAWGGAQAPTYAELIRAAAAEPVSTTLIDPDDPRFLGHGNMPARIDTYCRETGQRPPDGPAAVVRCVLDSLVCRQRQTLERAEALTRRRVDVAHLVGGGAASVMLSQLTADVLGRPVLAGPVEATGVGNLLVQAQAAGEIGSLAELRDVVRRSLPPHRYEPGPARRAAQDAYGRFQALLAETGGMV
jgi:rhamnulokinase